MLYKALAPIQGSGRILRGLYKSVLRLRSPSHPTIRAIEGWIELTGEYGEACRPGLRWLRGLHEFASIFYKNHRAFTAKKRVRGLQADARVLAAHDVSSKLVSTGSLSRSGHDSSFVGADFEDVEEAIASLDSTCHAIKIGA